MRVLYAAFGVFFITRRGYKEMIVVLKPNTTEQDKQQLIAWLQARQFTVHSMDGEKQTVLGLVGDAASLDAELVASFDMVHSVKRVSDPLRCCSRRYHEADTVIEVGGARIGGGSFCLIAGPCSVESEQQIVEVAQKVKAAGATVLRGGAFKPRTSPYDFQGLAGSGIELLLKAKQETGLPIVSEIMSAKHLPLFEQVDIIQVGARNMQNFELLKELGRLNKPVLLKRGLANTLHELLMSAEYIMAGGNEQVILCERGFRTFEHATRNTLDLSAVPVLHSLSHLPVVVDPSHATGQRALVPPMALAAAACGADGLMTEVHNDPMCALCDGAQSLTTTEFENLAKRVFAVRAAALG